jgi:hypothetical protein
MKKLITATAALLISSAVVFSQTAPVKNSNAPTSQVVKKTTGKNEQTKVATTSKTTKSATHLTSKAGGQKTPVKKKTTHALSKTATTSNVKL